MKADPESLIIPISGLPCHNRVMPNNRLNIFLDLMQIVERGFIFKLRAKNPGISEEDVRAEVNKWYMQRPGAEQGDSDDEPGDVSRFYK